MLMKLTFIGADHEVTGSCHFLEVGDTKVLIDCGMEQGRMRNFRSVTATLTTYF